MDQARSLRDQAADAEARRDQAVRDAEDAERDAANARTEAAGYASQAAQQRQEAASSEGDQAEILNGNAQDNELRERDTLSAAQSDDERAAELRATADRYGEEAQGLYAQADTAEAEAERQAEDDKKSRLQRDIAWRAAENTIGSDNK